MKHVASPRFWRHYRALPDAVRKLADKNFALLKADPHHPSLHFKKIDSLWSVRVGAHYRALGLDKPEAIVWFWIGPHAVMTGSSNLGRRTNRLQRTRLSAAILKGDAKVESRRSPLKRVGSLENRDARVDTYINC